MGEKFYPGEAYYSSGTAGSNLLGIFVLTFLLLLIAVTIVSTYILHSIGLYAIAKRRQIRQGWLAWVPIGNLWILGSVSDQYGYVVKGKIKNRRIQLVGLSVSMVALYIVCFLCVAVSEKVGWTIPGYWVCLAAMVIFSAIKLVLQFMAYHDLYESCDPDNGGVFLILSIVFPVAMPFFVFVCRKKEKGMPPRKKQLLEADPEESEE